MPITWHPDRVMDWCMSEDEKRWWKQQIVVSKKECYAEPKNVLEEDVEIWSKRGYNQRLLWTKTNN